MSNKKPSLYHGTNFNFNIGDKVLPASLANVPSNYDDKISFPTFAGEGSPEFDYPLKDLRYNAFATEDIEEAINAGDIAAEKRGSKTKVFRVDPLNYEDLDADPNSSGIRSATGFRVTSEVSGKELVDVRKENFVTNLLDELRIPQSGEAFFLHTSSNLINVGEKIEYSTSRVGKGMATDSMAGRTYGWDLLDSESTYRAFHTLDDAGDIQRYIYITKAQAENVRPDLNVGDVDGKFRSSASRSIIGEQDILGRISIEPGTSFEEAHERVLKSLQDLNMPSGFRFRDKEESKLANLAVLLDSRAQQESKEYLHNHLRQTAELRYGQFEQGIHAYSESGIFKELGEIGRTQGKEAFIDAVIGQNIADNAFPMGVRKGVSAGISSIDIQNLDKEVGTFFEKATKAVRGMPQKTLQSIIDTGEIAAKIMRL